MNSLFWNINGNGRVTARWVVPGIAVAYYAASFVLPTFKALQVELGAEAFSIGWNSLISFESNERDYWILSFAWLANPAIWIAIIAAGFGRWRMATLAAGCGVVLCWTAMLRFSEILATYPGFWAWSGSASVLLVGSLLMWRQTRMRSFNLDARFMA